MAQISDAIRYRKPDIASLYSDGYHPVDMHLHTNHSDGMIRIPDLLRYASHRKIGVAITDHNEISGSLKALVQKSDVLIIPGIELETLEGPHLLFYFYSPGDLQDFFRTFSIRRNQGTPGFPKNLPVMECLQLAEPYECLRIAAHPFGYYGINRGVLKCVEKKMLPGVMAHIDGIEVICGGMMESLNRRAIAYAHRHEIPYTGGSDAHVLSDVGNVVTAVRAETVEEFLKGISKRENFVIGKTGGYLTKGATAGVIAWSFVPYSLAKLGAHYTILNRRTHHFLSSCRKNQILIHGKREDPEKLEKR